jgi:hypothetical protein
MDQVKAGVLVEEARSFTAERSYVLLTVLAFP